MSVKKRPFTIGADPEFFIRDVKKKVLISAHDLFPGTKTEPFKVAGGAVQVDGVALEINVNPSSTEKEFLANLAAVSKVAGFMLRKRDDTLKIVVEPTAFFPEDYFFSLPEDVRRLGCSPDFDAFNNGEQNPSPQTNLAMRTAAGHLHVGWTENEDTEDPAHLFDCFEVSKQLAAALYYPSHAWDSDQRRRMLYGKIGACRPKSYGVEWRALSNAWCKDSEVAAWVFRSAQFANDLLDANIRLWETAEFQEQYQKSSPPNRHEILKQINVLEEFGFDPLPDALMKELRN